MRFLSVLAATVLLFAAGLPARAISSSADADHVHVQLVAPQGYLPQSGQGTVGLYFKIEQGWHIYWHNAGDAGEPPHINWTLPAVVTAGPLEFPAPKRLPLGPLMDFGYEDEALFPIPLQVAAQPGPVTLHAKVDWLVCQDRCIPGKTELEITREVVAGTTPATTVQPDAEIFRRLIGRLPKAPPASLKLSFATTKEGFQLNAVTGHRETQALFFPDEQEILDNPAPQKLTPTADGFVLGLKKDAALAAAPKTLKGILELSGDRAYQVAIMPGAAQPSAAQGSGAAGRENAVTIPLPPAQSDSVARQVADTPLKPSPAAPFSATKLLRISGLALLGGLILNLMPCVFPVLFLKGLALVQSGHHERAKLRSHGLVYAAGILASFWILVAALLALRAAGSSFGWGFQFQSPVFLALMASLLFFLGLSLAGQFEIGLTLTSAGGSLAQKQGYTGSFFTGVLAVVVATPCTAPFMGAAIGYALAQPAAVTFAVFTALALGLAAPYLALTLQPAWTRLLPRPGAWMEVLRQATAVPIFATVIWLAWVLARAYGAALLASLLASFLLLAVAGWFLGRWPAKRWSAIISGLILLAVIALSAIAPGKLVDAAPSAQAEATGQWEPWSPQAVSRYQQQKIPILVDFTASWCLSCQVNERVALNQPEVREALRAHGVALLRADWTRHDDNITQALVALGRSGVPAYALYTPGQSAPQLLPEVLTPGIVLNALSTLPGRQ